MSPIWIPWFAFWAVVVVVMLRTFRNAARYDRVINEAIRLNTWPKGDVIYYIKRIQHRRSLGITNSDELEFLEALKLNLKRRGKNLEG